MKLNDYRDLCLRRFHEMWLIDLKFISQNIPRMKTHLDTLRGMSMFSWYGAVLIEGAGILAKPYSLLESIFEDQCNRRPTVTTTGELVLAGHANLFSCTGRPDLTHLFRQRLYDVRTKRNSDFAAWHHAKALAGIALAEKGLYRGPSGASVSMEERMPFQPGELHGYNPQSLIAHLAGAVENQATIEDVWPAFREHVHNFPSQEAAGEFDGACLFWIARIVYHQIGGQPLGETAAWLHRHFNAWADGADLPPLES
jgi:hypothetical protein